VSQSALWKRGSGDLKFLGSQEFIDGDRQIPDSHTGGMVDR